MPDKLAEFKQLLDDLEEEYYRGCDGIWFGCGDKGDVIKAKLEELYKRAIEARVEEI